jgi:hypothetical protein
MLTGIKNNDLKRANDIHERILKLSDNLSFHIFPIYVRYLKGDELFALLYFNINKSKDIFVLGIATPNKISKRFEDASWMKYRKINYCTKINADENLDTLFDQIKSKIKH